MPEPQVTPPPPHCRLAVHEHPSVTRFFFSNGAVVDVESVTTHSGMRAKLLVWAAYYFGDKEIKIESAIVIDEGVLGDPVIVSTWENEAAPEPKKSSGTSTQRSTPTTKNRKPRVRPKRKQ